MIRQRARFIGSFQHKGETFYEWHIRIPGDSRVMSVRCKCEWFWNTGENKGWQNEYQIC